MHLSYKFGQDLVSHREIELRRPSDQINSSWGGLNTYLNFPVVSRSGSPRTIDRVPSLAHARSGSEYLVPAHIRFPFGALKARG